MRITMENKKCITAIPNKKGGIITEFSKHNKNKSTCQYSYKSLEDLDFPGMSFHFF